MKNESISNELSASYPDSFHVMSEEEIKQHCYYQQAPQWSIYDEQQHVLISVAYKKSNFLINKLTNTESLTKNMEGVLAKQLAGNDFQYDKFTNRDIDGITAYGVEYDYTVQELGMHACSYILNSKKNLYYIHAYVRQENKEESLKTVNEILDGFKWQ